jgi:peptidoglycan/LPS O-acetylase OafA/YrhL
VDRQGRFFFSPPNAIFCAHQQRPRGNLAYNYPSFMKSGRIPELDGLRALAIIPILFVHSTAVEHSRFNVLAAYGWIGVDLFFVLSGFLITGILLDAKGEEGYFRNFYARRVLRIWPVYFALLFFVLVVIPHFRPAARDLVKFSPWYYILFLQNVFPFGEFVPILAPTWSLGVEEQFYFLWPLLIALSPRRVFPLVIAVALVASPFVRMATLHFTGDWLYIYVLTFCRADGLLVGAALAYWMRSESYSEARLFSFGRWATALTVVPILWIFSRGIAARGMQSFLIYSFLALAFGGLISLALSPRATLLRRFLRFSALQYIGKISYGLYLIHKLAYVVYEKSSLYSILRVPGSPGLDRTFTFVAEVSFAVLAASLSWYLLETPVLRLKRYFERSTSAPMAAEAAATS